MSSKTFLWIEDRKGKASYTFWQVFLSQLFPEIQLDSKMNNSELVKAVRDIDDVNNKYIIVYDNSFDNIQVIMEQKILKKLAEERENVLLFNIICFEYILLEFRDLIEWIYAPEDKYLEKRAGAIAARNILVNSINKGEMNYKEFRDIIKYDANLSGHNIEQLSAKLLFDLTRNTGFEVSKGKIGECWIKSCCGFEERKEDDICGLDHSHLEISEKMKKIYEYTSLKAQFKSCGLEAAV